MSTPQILILTTSHLCRNPRVLKEARTLGAAGYRVTVASVSQTPRFEELDRVLTIDAPFRRQVLDHTGSTFASRAAAFVPRARTWLARRIGAGFGRDFASALGPTGPMLRLALRLPADLTILHNEIALWSAASLSRAGRRLAVDMEDWYAEDLLAADRRGRPIQLLRQAEAFALNHCAYASATSQAMSRALQAAYGCPAPIVIRNTFPLQPDPRTGRPPASAAPRFVWFSQTIGPGRGLEVFLSAWKRLRMPSELHLIGNLGPAYRQELLGSLPESLRSRLFVRPPVPPDALPSLLAEFDLGLALEPRTPLNRDITITNKILQYLNAGLALVATRTAGQSEVLQSAPDAGLPVPEDDPGALAALLDGLLADPARLRAMQRAARHAAETMFSWEHDAPWLLDAVASAVGIPAVSP